MYMWKIKNYIIYNCRLNITCIRQVVGHAVRYAYKKCGVSKIMICTVAMFSKKYQAVKSLEKKKKSNNRYTLHT